VETTEQPWAVSINSSLMSPAELISDSCASQVFEHSIAI